MKKILAFILVMLILAALCGCGDDPAVSPDVVLPDTGNGTGTATVTPTTPSEEKVSVWIITGSQGDGSGVTVLYDENYNLQTVEATRGTERETFQYRFEVNQAGKLVSQSVVYSAYPDMEPMTESFQYDANGNEITKGSVYTYDADGRILSETTEFGTVHNFTYDANGNLTKEECIYSPENISYTTYEYDDQGREIACDRDAYSYKIQYNEDGGMETVTVNEFYNRNITSQQVFVSVEQAEAIREQQKLLLEIVVAC